jgi:hypothetical protein
MTQHREERLAVRTLLQLLAAPRPRLERILVDVAEERVHRLGAQEEPRGRREAVRARAQMLCEGRVLSARPWARHGSERTKKVTPGLTSRPPSRISWATAGIA